MLMSAFVLSLLAATAETPPAPDFPMHIPTKSGEVILATPGDKQNYDEYGFAQVRRAGDLVFVSGVIVGRRPGEGNDVEAFKAQTRRAFRRIQGALEAAGLGFDDVVMINSFHIWSGPNFTGARDQQFEAFEQVKEEFMHGPHPAWTAVGTTGLLYDGGIVEVQMIAKAPDKR
jgi:enamine deaminase RidA (YjgF/YER057c/UK114 family)